MVHVYWTEDADKTDVMWQVEAWIQLNLMLFDCGAPGTTSGQLIVRRGHFVFINNWANL